MLPYTMSFCGEDISLAYISGVCTLPSERGKGLMKQLMQQAFDEMRRRKIALTALIPAEPWLFGYYREAGYTEAFEYAKTVYTHQEYLRPGQDCVVRMQKPTREEAIYAYFDRKLRERRMCILHSVDDFLTIQQDIELSGGKLFMAYEAHTSEPVGMAFAGHPHGSATEEASVLIKEIFFNSEQVKNSLLYEITKHFKVEKAVCRLPFDNKRVSYPYGMARVMDVERLVALWAAAHPESSLSESEMIAMDIRALTAHLLDYPNRAAYMSLMLD
jgi:predicted GNAT family acetyltransferase